MNFFKTILIALFGLAVIGCVSAVLAHKSADLKREAAQEKAHQKDKADLKKSLELESKTLMVDTTSKMKWVRPGTKAE